MPFLAFILSFRIFIYLWNVPIGRKAAQKQVRQDELDRIPIEGKFGQGKHLIQEALFT
jgi:hypothetical protein